MRNTKQLFDGLSYQAAQKRNSVEFFKLEREQQKKARHQGYKNIGWKNVRVSWLIIQNLTPEILDKVDNVVDIYSYKTSKENLTTVDVLDVAIAQTESLIAKGETLSKKLLSKLR